MAAGYDGSIRIDTRVDTRGFNSGIKGITSSLGKLAGAVGLAFGVTAIVNFGRTAVKEATNLASAMTGLQSVIDGQGRSWPAAEKFIQSYTQDGLVPATNAIVAYKNLALRGYDTGQIETVMTALKDSAAFGKAASYTMGEAIQMASEGLKNENSILVDNAGVTKNVAQMWKEYAASIGTSTAALTQQQKIQAEVNGILEETKYQTGDAAKLSGGFAGMIAALGTSFYNLKVALGNAIIPILAQIIPYIKAIVDWFVVLFNTVARVLALFFGTSASMADMETSSGETASNLGGSADSADDLAKNTTKAGKAAKGALAAFDELNVLQMEESTSGADAGAGGLEVPTPEAGESPISEALDEWTDDVLAFKEALLDFLDPSIEALGRLKEALIPLGETIWSGLKWAWENILVPMGEWVFQDAVPAFLDLLGAAAGVLNDVLIALKPIGIWLYEEFLKPLGVWAGQAIIDALGWLTEKLEAFSDWINNNGEKASEILGTIVIVLGSLALGVWLVSSAVAFGTGVMGAFAAVMALVTSPVFLVGLAIGALIAAVILLIKNWDKVKDVSGDVWQKIVEIWNGAGEWFKENVTEPIGKWFDSTLEDIGEFFSSTWDDIVDIWEGVPEWFQTTVIDPIEEGFKIALDWIKEKWETIFTGISNFVKGIINGVIDLLNGLLTGIATVINGIVDAANAVGGLLPGWTNLPHVSAPKIPRLATGAVIPPNAEFLALLGDQRSGRNLEAPEALIRQIVREEAGGAGEISIRFEGTLGALVRELKPYIDRENTRIGRSLAAGGIA